MTAMSSINRIKSEEPAGPDALEMTLPNVPSWKHSSFYPIKAIDAIFEGFDFVMSAWSIA